MTKRVNTLHAIAAPHRNIELKARDPDRARSLATCERLGARRERTLRQSDTYFFVSHGRLKLREESGSTPQLIAYDRPDCTDERESSYRIVEVGAADELLSMLSSTLGVRAVVTKERRLYLWEGIRIHLDDVEGLGTFVEFEAVAHPGSDLSREERQVRRLRSAFSLTEENLVASSYCDLVEASR